MASIFLPANVSLLTSIRRRERRFRAMVERGGETVALLGADLCVIYVTPTVQNVCGYAESDLIGTSVFDYIHPDDRHRAEAGFEDIIHEAGRSHTIALRIRDAAGAWRDVDTAITNHLGDEAVRAIVINCRDITDRLELERRLARIAHMDSLGRAAARIAHEFNNVLMSIAPLADLLRRRAGDVAFTSSTAGRLADAVRRGSTITREITGYTSPIQAILEPISLAGWLTHLTSELRPLLGSAFTLKVSDSDQALQIHADKAQLAQVFSNLVINARDAMTEGGVIEISAARATRAEVARVGLPDDTQYVHLAVSDNGPGMPESVRAKAFEPFFTTKPRGSGIGLSVVKKIVTAHGGELTLDSESGRGTTFHIYIPSAGADRGGIGRALA